MKAFTISQAPMRLTIAAAIAALYACVCYFLAQSQLWQYGLFSVTFAVVQPAAICAFVAFVGDPMGRRPRRYYTMVPFVLAVGMIVIALFAFREGVVCIVMLTPIWLLSGLTGTALLQALMPRLEDIDKAQNTFRASILLALPLVLMPLEQALPLPQDRYEVSRSVEINADAQSVWALMQSVPEISAEEGEWNITQSLIGVPRPLSATLSSESIGAVRHAHWAAGIRFEEHITDWQEGKAIAWDFVFPPSNAWNFTDSHLHPDSEHIRIESGGYHLEQLGPGKLRLTLYTSYSARTRINPYAALWGEFFLGDIQSNILRVIKDRAEGG